MAAVADSGNMAVLGCFQQWWCFMVIVSICVHGQLVFVAVGGCCGQLLLFAMWAVVVGHCVC